MKNSFILIISLLYISGACLNAQENTTNGKALNIPTRKFGISIGNSTVFNGIRINFADKNVKRINGLNMTFWVKSAQNQEAVVNGISMGVIPAGGTMQPVNIGILGVGAHHDLNGMTFSGLFIGGSGTMHGISTSGIFTEMNGITGIGISGLVLGGETINGIGIGGLVIFSMSKINGIAVSPGAVFGKEFNGLAASAIVSTRKMHGLSLALYNWTQELHGVQIGLLNYARNNPKGLRWLPFINLHLADKKEK